LTASEDENLQQVKGEIVGVIIGVISKYKQESADSSSMIILLGCIPLGCECTHVMEWTGYMQGTRKAMEEI
jgi:hypothetical protein